MNLQTPGPITASPSYNFSDTWVSYIKTEKELPDELFGKPLHQNIAQTRYSHKYGKGKEALTEADASAQLLVNSYNLLDSLARKLNIDANLLAKALLKDDLLFHLILSHQDLLMQSSLLCEPNEVVDKAHSIRDSLISLQK